MKDQNSDPAAVELGSAGGCAGTPKQTTARRRNMAKALAARLEKQSPEERREQASKAVRAAHARKSPEERSEIIRRAWQTRKANAGK